MSTEKIQSPIEMMLDKVDFKPVSNPSAGTEGLPYVTHEGLLQIGTHSIRVMVLNDGQRIIQEDDLNEFIKNTGNENL